MFRIERQSAFTLLELMVVVAIIATLAALALPAYQQQIRQARRAEALTLLTTVANQQQRRLTREGVYSADPGELTEAGSTSGFYQLRLVIHDSSPISLPGIGAMQCDGTPCFKLAAVAIGAQSEDTDCALLTIDQFGRKRSYNSAGQNPPGPDDPCW